MSKQQFIIWLGTNTRLGSTSIMKYASAIDTISEELGDYGLSRINLYNTSETYLIDKIMSNTDFEEKNKRGHNMYSCALNYFKEYIRYSNR